MKQTFISLFLSSLLFPAGAAQGAVQLPTLPLRFEAHPSGTLVSRGKDFEIRLNTDPAQVLLQLPGEGVAPIRMQLEGSASDLFFVGEEPVGFTANYFRGSNRFAWMTEVLSFERVRARSVYAGIDLVFYGSNDELEFDFEIAPEADPSRIVLVWGDAPSLKLATSGDLVLTSSGAEIRLAPPRAYQRIGQEEQTVSCRFVLLDSDSVGFLVGDYDPALPLVIDPVLTFSSYLGWAESEALSGIVQDAGGNYYLSGWTDSVGLPAGNVLQKEKAGGRDVFVAKLTPGHQLSWITYVGGARDDIASDILLDSKGNIFVVGSTGSSDFPVTEGVKQGTYGGGVSDAFLLKLNSSGSALGLSTFLGGSGEDIANTLSFASNQDILVTGSTRSGNFPVTSGVFQSTLFGGTDSFVTRVSPDGAGLVFSTYFGGRSNDNPVAILEQADGLILSAGTTNSSDLRLEKPIQDSIAGGSDAYISLIRSDGKGMEFSTFLGGRSNDTIYGAVIDSEGAIVIGGETSSDNFPLVDPIQNIYKGGTDMFIARLEPDRSAVSAATYLGGAGYDSLRDLKVLPDRRVYLAGVSNSTDLPLTGTTAIDRGSAEVVAAAVDLDRSWLAYCSYLGGSENEIPSGMSLGLQHSILVAGATNSLDFPAVGGLQAAFGGTGIVRSASGGQQWEESGQGLPDPNVLTLRVMKDSSWVYAGTLSSGIFLSKDKGSTWESIGPEGQGIVSIAVDPKDSKVILAGTSGSLMQTKDGGETWETLSDGDRLPFTKFTALAFDPKSSQVIYAGTSQTGLFKSDNGGQKWIRQTSSLDAAGNAIFSLVVDPVNTSTVFIGTAGSVYKYIPNPPAGEGPWKKMSVVSSDGIRGLAMDPANPQHLYAAIYVAGGPQPGYYVARTEDGGTVWKTSPNTLPAAVTSLAVSPSDRAVIFAATSGEGIYKSSDTAVSWSDLNQDLDIRNVLTFAVDPQSSSRMYAGYESSSDGFIAELRPTNQFYFPQIADGVQGRIKFQTAFVFVNTGADTTVRMEFFNSAGDPLAIRVGQNPAAPQIEIPIGSGGAYYAQTPADPGLRVGYARVTAGPGVDGTAIFTRTDGYTKVPLYEAGVPATRAAADFVFLLDSLGDRDTGIALVNTAEGLPDEEDPATIELSLRDSDGYLIEETSVSLPRGHHVAKFIAELFPSIAAQVSEMRGLITVKCPVPVAALTLRQRDKPLVEYPQEVASLTPFPVMAPSSLGSTLFFPQIADGVWGTGVTATDQFQTTFFIANPGSGSFSTSFALEFFNSTGQPMAIDLGSGQAVSKVTGSLQPGRFRVFETTGAGNPQIGYARLTASNPVIGGTAVFTQRSISHNATLFEAGVAATLPRRKFSIFLDSIGVHDTGLALVNTSTEAADITLRLYDLDSHLVYEKTLDPLEPGHHLPQFIFQLLPEVAEQAGEMRGVVTVESNQPLAAVTLRQKNDSSVDFPTEVPTLTTFPVVAGFAPIE